MSKYLNPGHYMFLPARNDSLLNGYTPVLTLGWLANMDITPCTSPNAVLHYIAKYASKSEQQSISYKDILTDIIPKCGASNDPMLSVICKFLNSMLAERDWSAQEVMHILGGNKLTFCSRTFIDLNLKDFKDRSFAIESVNGELIPGGISLLEKYMTRITLKRDFRVTAEEIQSLTLLQCCRKWKFSGKANELRISFCPRLPARVVKIFPRPKLDSNAGDKSSND